MNLDGLIGIKKNQGQAFLEDGKRVPVSVILTSGNIITQVKSADKEGYNSIQLGFGNKTKTTKAKLGNGKKAGLDYSPVLFKEIRVDEAGEVTPGTEIKASEVFQAGDIIDAIGTSKGKGFAGVVKRHHFKGGPRTHGQSDRERAPGSIGQTTTPGRVYKGKRMAGRMGHETVTVKNLEILEVKEDGTILINGLVPGAVNSYILIRKVGENKKFVPLYKEVVEEEVQAEAPVEPVAEPTEEAKEEANVELEAEVPAQAESQAVEAPAEEVKTEENVQTPEETVETPSEEVKEETEEVKEGEEHANS